MTKNHKQKQYKNEFLKFLSSYEKWFFPKFTLTWDKLKKFNHIHVDNLWISSSLVL